MSFQPQIEYSSLGGNKKKMLSLSQIYTEIANFLKWHETSIFHQIKMFLLILVRLIFNVTYQLLNHIEIHVCLLYQTRTS